MQESIARYIAAYRDASLEAIRALPVEAIARLIEMARQVRDRKAQIFICGNGGSASTATHFANDLGKDASYGRRRRFRVLSLSDNIPWLTALANDTDYSQVFVEQLKNFADPGDLLIAMSGSGNSPNLIEAVRWGNQHELLTVGLTGRPGGALGELAQFPIFIESSHMGHIQEAHFLVQHLVGYYFVETES